VVWSEREHAEAPDCQCCRHRNRAERVGGSTCALRRSAALKAGRSAAPAATKHTKRFGLVCVGETSAWPASRPAREKPITPVGAGSRVRLSNKHRSISLCRMRDAHARRRRCRALRQQARSARTARARATPFRESGDEVSLLALDSGTYTPQRPRQPSNPTSASRERAQAVTHGQHEPAALCSSWRRGSARRPGAHEPAGRARTAGWHLCARSGEGRGAASGCIARSGAGSFSF
jgi:hypothetical protein